MNAKLSVATCVLHVQYAASCVGVMSRIGAQQTAHRFAHAGKLLIKQIS